MKSTLSSLIILAAALPLASTAAEPNTKKTAETAIQAPAEPAAKKAWPAEPPLPAGPAVKKTVEAIYAEKAQLNGKKVQVRGKVTKVFNGAMERNFLHLSDGTGKEESNDLTLTSQQTANEGDEITVTGVLTLDRDFGSGYKYPLILESSAITNQKPAKKSAQ